MTSIIIVGLIFGYILCKICLFLLISSKKRSKLGIGCFLFYLSPRSYLLTGRYWPETGMVDPTNPTNLE